MDYSKFYLLFTVRRMIKAQEGLRPGPCGPASDFCAVLCCLPCTLAQLMRHVGMTGRNGYQLCSKQGVSDAAPSVPVVQGVLVSGGKS